jgi:hypothetical protein
MHSVTSFDGSALRPEELSALVDEYLAVERARIWRRLLTTRFGTLGALIVGTGMTLHWLPPLACWVTGGLCGAAPIGALIVELRRDWRLGRHLQAIPGGATYVLPATPSRQHTSDA